jgi:hypothetical protein
MVPLVWIARGGWREPSVQGWEAVLNKVTDKSEEERFFFLFPQKIKKKGVKQKENVGPLVWTALRWLEGAFSSWVGGCLLTIEPTIRRTK